VGLLKSTLKSLLYPVRVRGGRFFIPPPDDTETIVWKAAQMLGGEIVEGDYLEFGVFRGDSFIRAFRIIGDVYQQRPLNPVHSTEYRKQASQLWGRMRFFAFDSFQGLPAPGAIDKESRDFVEGKFTCDLEGFKRNLENCGVDLSKVVVVPGWFQQTCTPKTIETHKMKAASIIHIDCDLYESAKIVLKFVEPLLVDGSVLIFDDWYCFRGNPALGEQRAFTEWAKTMRGWIFSEYQKEGSCRNSFIANRASDLSP
jgi:O-methyltransferase